MIRSMNLNLHRDRRITDMTGQRLDGSRVLHRVRSSGDGARWLLRCECGTEYEREGKVVRRQVSDGLRILCGPCAQRNKPRRNGSQVRSDRYDEQCREVESILSMCHDEGLTEDETQDVLVAALGEMSRSAVAIVLGVTSERVRQIEESGLRKLRMRKEMREHHS